jgi:hypothetical protein
MKHFAMLLATFALATACHGQAPVAAFGLDEGSGSRARDSSPHGLVARVPGAEWVRGADGTALSFARPEAAVRVPSRRWLQLGSQLSLSAWVYPTIADEQSRIIIAKNDEYLLRMDKQSEGGRISFFVQVGTPAVNWEPRVSSEAPPALHVWHHVLAAWDGARLRLYLDGELQAETLHAGFPNPNPYPVMIGNFEYPSCHGGNFGGLIGQVRIYARALTPGEVRAEFAAGRSAR